MPTVYYILEMLEATEHLKPYLEASRIEAANKQAGTRLLISEETYSEVKDQVRVGQTINATLPGKKGEYALYEVIALTGSTA